MLFQATTALLSFAAIAEGLSIKHQNLDGMVLRRTPTKRQAAAATCLSANSVATGSTDNGQNPPVAGQSASLTDAANFINFCSGQTITNGLQTTAGSCNPIVMGKIPSNNNMISSIIVSPKPAEDLAANTDFTISVQTTGLAAGSFTNAQKTYYAAPQDLDGSGKIIGHTHVTVQDLGNTLAPTKALDPKVFVFFKGINDAGNGNGLLSAVVTGGLPAGNYRVCSMTSSSNHQPVLMPVAQRGAQDDCQKFTVGAGGNAGGNAGGATGGNAGGATGGNAGGATGGNAGGATGGATGGNAGNAASSAIASAVPAASSTAAVPAASSTAAASASATSAAVPAATTAAGGATGGNNAAAIGGITAPPVIASGDKSRPFSVNGNTFVNESAAKQRSCDIQNNKCSDAVNSGKIPGGSIGACQAQAAACNAA